MIQILVFISIAMAGAKDGLSQTQQRRLAMILPLAVKGSLEPGKSQSKLHTTIFSPLPKERKRSTKKGAIKEN